jgi:hypothetical protein
VGGNESSTFIRILSWVLKAAFLTCEMACLTGSWLALNMSVGAEQFLWQTWHAVPQLTFTCLHALSSAGHSLPTPVAAGIFFQCCPSVPSP